jgi:hypothetical protein
MRQVQTWCEPWPERTVGGLEISYRFTRRYLSRCQKVWYKFDLLTSASPCIDASTSQQFQRWYLILVSLQHDRVFVPDRGSDNNSSPDRLGYPVVDTVTTSHIGRE